MTTPPLCGTAGSLTAVLVLIILSGDVLRAQTESKLTAADGALNDRFAQSVAVNGDVAIAGARFNDAAGPDSGAAYIYRRTDGAWVQEAKLVPSDGEAQDEFGYAVDIEGDLAIVGAPRDDDDGFDAGAAYVFERIGASWTQVDKLTPDDGFDVAGFGLAVAISGGRAVVGTQFAEAVYVFSQFGALWPQEAKIEPGDVTDPNGFGAAVELDGDRVLVGAPADDDNGNNAGAAYVFLRNGTLWSFEQKLLASDGAAGDFFGREPAVDIAGDRVVVGANLNDEGGLDAGAAYIFLRTGTAWSEEAKLTADDPEVQDHFGTSAGIDGLRVIIGAENTDDDGVNSGSAYVFELSGSVWNQTTKLTASDAASGDVFGVSARIDGERCVVGALGDDDNGASSGSAYIFDLDAPGGGVLPPVANAGPDQKVECIGPQGATVALDGSGSFDPDGGDLNFLWNGPFGEVAGMLVKVDVPLGKNAVTLNVADNTDTTSSDEVMITVKDSADPKVKAELVPVGFGDDRFFFFFHPWRRYRVEFSCGDACDPDAKPEAYLVAKDHYAADAEDSFFFHWRPPRRPPKPRGIPVENGQIVTIDPFKTLLLVLCEDRSGNETSVEAEAPNPFQRKR